MVGMQLVADNEDDRDIEILWTFTDIFKLVCFTTKRLFKTYFFYSKMTGFLKASKVPEIKKVPRHSFEYIRYSFSDLYGR